ncbi:MAG: CHAT domain-containing protein [Bacteroidia bacterium]
MSVILLCLSGICMGQDGKASAKSPFRVTVDSLAKLQKKGEFQASLDGCNQLISTNPIVGPEDSMALIKLHSTAGISHRLLGNWDEALTAFRRVEKIIANSFLLSQKHSEVAKPYLNQGNIYAINHHFEKALSAFRKAKHSAEKDTSSYGRIVEAYCLLSIGLAHANQFELAQSIEYFRQSLGKIKQGNPKHQLISQLYSETGRSFMDMGEMDSARFYLTKGLDWVTANGVDWVPFQLNILEQLGHLERKDRHYKEALKIYNSHLALTRKTYGTGKRKETYMDAYLCLTHMYMGNCSQSKKAFWESMKIFFPHDKNLRPLTRVNLDSLENPSKLFWTLNTALRSYAHCDSNNLKELLFADSLVHFSTRLIRHMLADIDSRKALAREQARAHRLIGASLEVKYSLYKLSGDKQYVDDAFQLMQFAKGLLFNEQVEDPSRIRLFSKTEIGHRIPQGTALIHYFSSPVHTWAAVVQDGDISLHRFESLAFSTTDSLLDAIQAPYLGTNSKMSPQENRSVFEHYSALLGQRMLEPLGKLPTNLIIIPDGPLLQLPFSLLKTDGKYVIEDHQLAYYYAISQFMLPPAPSRGLDILAFAPSFDNNPELPLHLASSRSGLQPLHHNLTEVETSISGIQGKIRSGKQANLGHFMTEASQYGIIHLASHAEVNPKNPDNSYIAFAPEADENSLLFLEDIYKLKLDAEMVVLSACNTARSANRQLGENQSLAHAFTYAGAQSLVATCWPVDDKAHAELMVDFYTGLKAGLSKSAALRQAKLIAIHDKGLEPFYWAAPLAYGDMRPIVFSKDHSLYFIIGFLVLLLLIGIKLTPESF